MVLVSEKTESSVIDTTPIIEKQNDDTIHDAETYVKYHVPSVKGELDDNVESVKETLNDNAESGKETLNDNVESVKETLTDNAESINLILNDNVVSVKEPPNNNLESVKETLNDNIESVKETLNDNVESVKETLNDNLNSVKKTLTANQNSVQEQLDANADSIQGTHNVSLINSGMNLADSQIESTIDDSIEERNASMDEGVGSLENEGGKAVVSPQEQNVEDTTEIVDQGFFQENKSFKRNDSNEITIECKQEINNTKEDIESYNNDINILVIGRGPTQNSTSKENSPKKSPKKQRPGNSWTYSTFGPPQTRATVIHQTNWSLRYF